MRKRWEQKKLGEICDTGAGGTPLKAHKRYYENGTIPWLLSGEVSQGEIFEAKNFITQAGLENSSAKLFPKNTVLVAMYGATAGQVGILRFEACTNQAVCGILPNKHTLPEFIYYCFLSKKDELVAQAVGGAQPNISQIKVKNTLVPHIPLSEQKRIVAILDEVFAAIDKAKENAERNLQNAKELFDSHVEIMFNSRKWPLAKLSDVCEFEKKQDVHVNLPYVGLEDIESNTGRFIGSDSPRKVKSTTFHFTRDHVLYGRLRPYLNKVLTPSFEGHCSTEIFPIKPNKKIDKHYLFHWLMSKTTMRKIDATWTGARMPRANMNLVLDFDIPCPTISEQKNIAQSIVNLSIKTKRLTAIYEQKITDLEELKKSLLHKAFNGELKTEKIPELV